jgi:hypothetical protein
VTWGPERCAGSRTHRRDRLEGADLHPAVRLVAGAVQHGHLMPGQTSTAVQERGLVGLHGEQVVRLLDRNQELRGLSVPLECVGGDHCPGQVEVAKQRLEARHLAGAPSTSRWASTFRLVCSMAASRWT